MVEIEHGDLDIIGSNSRSEPGDAIAEIIEQESNPAGPDDGDSLGISSIEPGVYIPPEDN